VVGRKRLIVVGLTVGVVGLILMFPARVAYQWFAPSQVVMSGISGTVWRGQAREATVDGFYLRDLKWRFRPLSLFTAKIGLSIDTRFVSGFATGDIAIGMSTVIAKNLQANLPIGAIQTAAAFGATGGSVSADITELKLDDGLPVVADGSLKIVGLTLPMVQRQPRGGFKAEMFTTETGISASIHNASAGIDLAGSLQLANDGA